MGDEIALSNEGAWYKVMNTVMKLPGVKVDRRDFLSKEFVKYCGEDEIESLMEIGTVKAGVSLELMDKVAGGVIGWHGTMVTGASFIAGLPGGLALLGTVPADLAQYYYHTLQVSQKLAYIYGYPDLDDGSDDDFSRNVTVFVGAMMGVASANEVLRELSKKIGQNVGKKLFREALTKTTYYPIIKQIAAYLGVKITKKTFSEIFTKTIPIIGGVISGGLTAAMFFTCANRLKDKLRKNVSLMKKTGD